MGTETLRKDFEIFLGNKTVLSFLENYKTSKRISLISMYRLFFPFWGIFFPCCYPTRPLKLST